MASRRVRTNVKYRYEPVAMDRFDSRTSAAPGEVVQVVALPGCPKPNTMGMCHIASTTRFTVVRGERKPAFLGLVLTNSLVPV